MHKSFSEELDEFLKYIEHEVREYFPALAAGATLGSWTGFFGTIIENKEPSLVTMTACSLGLGLFSVRRAKMIEASTDRFSDISPLSRLQLFAIDQIVSALGLYMIFRSLMFAVQQEMPIKDFDFAKTLTLGVIAHTAFLFTISCLVHKLFHGTYLPTATDSNQGMQAQHRR